MDLPITLELEQDGRWIADIELFPGVTKYGATPQEAIQAVEVLALEVIADMVEHNEMVMPKTINFLPPSEPLAA
jgi:predicted RNase H-like HicB family nuclease